MDKHSKRIGPGRATRAAVTATALAVAAAVGGEAPAEDKPEPPATAARFPTIPPAHPNARALLENAFRYVDPANKLVDPASGYPVEGWNQDPARGLFLRSFTQLTAIGLYMELLAEVVAGNADTPPLPRDLALEQLARLVRTLREDQRNPQLAAEGLLGNFLDLATGKRLGPLASDVDKSKFLDAFGPAKGEAVWNALREIGWIVPRTDGKEAAIQRGARYGYDHFQGPLAPFRDEPTRQKVMALLDARVVMLVFGDNANLSASVAKSIGALLTPEIKDRPAIVALRSELEGFLDAQRRGYTRLFDAKAGLFYFGWNATKDRLFGWEDLKGNWTTGHMDYLVNEFRGPATFIAARFGIPAEAIGNLGFKMKAYRPRTKTRDGGDLVVLAPWEGSAFQSFGLSVAMGERDRPSWRSLLRSMVAVEVDFAASKGLPGFLSESYTGDGTQYTGSVGIPEITVSPKPRIVDAASLYTLGVAYSIAPDEVEAFLAANRPTIASLFTDHGPWEGYNVARKGPIAFQTTAHTLTLALGLIGRGSDHMKRYLDARGLAARLDAFFEPGEGADLLAASNQVFAWTGKGSTLRAGREGPSFRVRGDRIDGFGVACLPAGPDGANLSGGLLTIRYKSAGALDPITIDLKPAPPASDASGLIPRQIFARLDDTGGREAEVRVQLPATPGLAHIKEFVITYSGPEKRPVDLEITHLEVARPAPARR